MTPPSALERRAFERSIDAVNPLMDWVETFVDAHANCAKTGHDVTLVIEELFTNHVRHQPGRSDLEVELRADPTGAITIELTDREAVEFDPRHVRDPRAEPGPGQREPGGLGLLLVQRLAETFDYTFAQGVAVTRVRIGARSTFGQEGENAC